MEGWLTKRRDHMNIIWLERYFVLDGNQLRYYRKRGDLTPRGTYVLTDGCEVSTVFNSEEKHKHHGAVWMFRIRFTSASSSASASAGTSVAASESNAENRSSTGSGGSAPSDKTSPSRKDRFLDLGAKTEDEAKEWKRAIEKAVSSIRELVLHQRKMKTDAEFMLAVPKDPPRLLKADEDTVNLFNLDSDNTKAEQGWWLARVEEGLRVMQECPLGHQVAAAMYAQHAQTSNGLVFSAIFSAILSFSIVFSFVENMLLCFCIAAAAMAVCCYAITPSHAIEIPSFRVSQVVHGSPTEVFQMLMNRKRYQRWDSSIATMKVIQEMDENADIVYITQRPVYLWPMWQRPRDLVLMRHWRREEDGSFFVMYQSVEHPECRVRHNFVRATILGGGFVIAPQKTASGSIRSLVTYVLRYDAGGWSRMYHQLGMDVDLVMPMLRSVVGIRDEMSAIDFITPMVTVSSTSAEEEAAEAEAIAKGGVSPPRVDASGVVVGVQKYPTNVPERMWAEPDSSLFRVRGPNYLSDKKKIPSSPAKFHLVGVDLFSFENGNDRYNVCARDGSIPKISGKYTFVVNMIVPGAESLCLLFYFQPVKDNVFEERSAFTELLDDFIDGDDQFRNSRFKMIPTVVEGSFIIRQAVGSKPTLLANKLRCPYQKGENYLEVDIDLSSSSVANTVVGMVRGVTKSLVVDMAFLLEAQSEEELPEVLLGAVRLNRISLDNPVRVPANAAVLPSGKLRE